MATVAGRIGLAIALAGALAGCGRSSAPVGELNPPMDSEVRRGHGGPRGHDRIPQGSDIEPHPAVLAVHAMLQSLRDGRLDEAYDFLPERFQVDVDRLLQERAAEVDPELWQAVTRTAYKGLLLLREQKSLILESLNQPESAAAVEELAASWDGLVDTLAELESSDLARLESLRRMESRRFLATTGNALFRGLRGVDAVGGGTPLDALLETRVTETTWPDGRVVLAITPPGQEHANLVEFVSIDGRWIPRPMADAWRTTLDAWRIRLALGDREAQVKARAAIAEFEASVDQMRAATTVEEFQAAAAPSLLTIYQTYKQWSQPPGPPGGVSLTVRGHFDDDEQTRILADLEPLTDDPPRSVYTATAGPDAMVISLRPVADVEAFARRLSFAVDLQIDAANRTVAFTHRAP
jgi:hypothetical protein